MTVPALVAGQPPPPGYEQLWSTLTDEQKVAVFAQVGQPAAYAQVGQLAVAASGDDGSAEERLTLLIHAASKVGKSTLSSTVPLPAVVLDAEGSWRFVPLRKKYWDPFTQPVPQWDGTWDVCVVHVRQWEAIDLVYSYLTQFPHQFVSVVMDSITEIQRRCRNNITQAAGSDQMKIQQWGTLLSRMDKVIRDYRDLTLITTLPIRCVVFIAETRERSGKWRPTMQGQIADSLPYWVDVCGYLYPQWRMDATGQPVAVDRYLFIGLHQQFESGNRVQGMLPDTMYIPPPNPGQVGSDIADMFVRIYGRPASPYVPNVATSNSTPPPAVEQNGVPA